MQQIFQSFAIASFVVSIAFVQAPAVAATALSDSDIQKVLIQQSLAEYPGNCPCPYNRDRAGRSCGKRSAYSKPDGYAPLCYPSDVTAADIEAYRKAYAQ